MNDALTEDRTQPARSSAFGWWHAAPRSAKKALVAASFGWMLDSFDVMLYSMVLASLMADLHLTKGAAGILEMNPSTLRSLMKRLGIHRPS